MYRPCHRSVAVYNPLMGGNTPISDSVSLHVRVWLSSRGVRPHVLSVRHIRPSRLGTSCLMWVTLAGPHSFLTKLTDADKVTSGGSEWPDLDRELPGQSLLPRANADRATCFARSSVLSPSSLRAVATSVTMGTKGSGETAALG